MVPPDPKPSVIPDPIGFDGDDTIWHNERSCGKGRRRVHDPLARIGVDASAERLDGTADAIEVGNLEYYRLA